VLPPEPVNPEVDFLLKQMYVAVFDSAITSPVPVDMRALARSGLHHLSPKKRNARRWRSHLLAISSSSIAVTPSGFRGSYWVDPVTATQVTGGA
jgi:hypothetical protein